MSDGPQIGEQMQTAPQPFGGEPAEGASRRRLVVFGVVVATLFGLLIMRLWFLQVVGANDFEARAAANSVRSITLPAARGEILDRNGVPLATNRDAWDVVATPADLTDADGELTDESRALVTKLVRGLGGDPALYQRAIEVRAKKNRLKFKPLPLLSDIDENSELFSALNERMNEFPGVRLVRTSKRVYPDQEYMTHVLGTVGKIQEEQVDEMEKRGYRPDAFVGQFGLERRYEEYLRGNDGSRKVEVDATGEATARGIISEKPAKPGLTLRTTLDLEVQKELANSLRWKVLTNGAEDSAGGGVVLDIATGEVIALASFPQLDQTLIDRKGGVSKKRYLARKPDYNRALAAYPPGSTFKPITALAALSSGVLTADEFIEAKKFVTLHGTRFTNFRLQYQGFISLPFAIAASSDTYFYEVGDRIWKKAAQPDQASGHTDLWSWAKALGFGSPTGIDIAGEAASVLPDRLWRALNNKPGSEIGWNQWRPGDSINMSVGQGTLTASPLQMARAYAALLDAEHRLLKPTIGSAVIDPTSQNVLVDLEKGRPETRLPEIDPALLDPILTGMAGATSNSQGTAVNVFGGMGGLVAGKTGTAQPGGKPGTRDHSWFVGYGPATPGATPKYVIAVVVEKSGLGGAVAAPVACRTMAVALQVDPAKCGSGAPAPGTAG